MECGGLHSGEVRSVKISTENICPKFLFFRRGEDRFWIGGTKTPVEKIAIMFWEFRIRLSPGYKWGRERERFQVKKEKKSEEKKEERKTKNSFSFGWGKFIKIDTGMAGCQF